MHAGPCFVNDYIAARTRKTRGPHQFVQPDTAQPPRGGPSEAPRELRPPHTGAHGSAQASALLYRFAILIDLSTTVIDQGIRVEVSDAVRHQGV